jgi:hypothetical protein
MPTFSAVTVQHQVVAHLGDAARPGIVRGEREQRAIRLAELPVLRAPVTVMLPTAMSPSPSATSCSSSSRVVESCRW